MACAIQFLVVLIAVTYCSALPTPNCDEVKFRESYEPLQLPVVYDDVIRQPSPQFYQAVPHLETVGYPALPELPCEEGSPSIRFPAPSALPYPSAVAYPSPVPFPSPVAYPFPEAPCDDTFAVPAFRLPLPSPVAYPLPEVAYDDFAYHVPQVAPVSYQPLPRLEVSYEEAVPLPSYNVPLVTSTSYQPLPEVVYNHMNRPLEYPLPIYQETHCD
ncbi:uncharacterized protein LOC130440763 [Diorhabda sublineata]|uniref:uncharacterized protein LOC130440763 n=1 Tax=Diorhabda sublineata TaxID=1163346 RepID=UPI0024E0909F|nr:uncharacterized protein LOC130440763 [Diorhabda sublineata]